MLPHAKVFGPAAALPAADAGCVLPPAEPAAGLSGATATLSAGAADTAAAADGAADAVAATDALVGAAGTPGSDLEHAAANAKPRAPAHTSRQSFIFFLSKALRLYNETKQA